MTRELFRLPNGERTKSVSRYACEWRALGRPFKAHLGWRLCAFDPDLMFTRPDGSAVYVAPDLADLVVKLAAKYREAK